ncbi:hypothetical protein CYMTET_11835 [Cymbomonas tetramitiformis]|uniref:Uncharacterized protein n=1 Tax=Cymbomonas tetramitiformis TaxID=36881 RepID=A0AAE0LCS0_9CHLO|nr:hypothetical protein CYMTET_11835 [Cymbomonas tetramitiformis]
MKTNEFRQNEDLSGLLEGTAELYVWSKTYDYLESRLITRSVGIPCVQAVARQYPVNAKIGAVGAGQSIRIGIWEWDDGWSDDSLGDHWILPEDFSESDTVLINQYSQSKWLLRCVGCRQLTGTAPDPFISDNPAFTYSTQDFLESGESTASSGNTLLGLWNYDSSSLRAAESMSLYSYSHTSTETVTSEDDSSSTTTDITVTFDVDCTNCYAGTEDGELVVDYVTNLTEGWRNVAAEVNTDFKLNVELLLTLDATLTETSNTNIIKHVCLPPACIGFDLLGVGWQVGFMLSLDVNTQLNAQAEFTLNPGFEMVWHVGYGFAYTHDNGPTTFAADSQTTFTPRYPEVTGDLDVEIDLAFVPEMTVGIWIETGFAAAHALASIKTEAYLILQGTASSEVTTGTELTAEGEELDDFAYTYGDCEDRHNIEYKVITGLRETEYEFGYRASLGWEGSFLGYVWMGEYGPYKKPAWDFGPYNLLYGSLSTTGQTGVSINSIIDFVEDEVAASDDFVITLKESPESVFTEDLWSYSIPIVANVTTEVMTITAAPTIQTGSPTHAPTEYVIPPPVPSNLECLGKDSRKGCDATVGCLWYSEQSCCKSAAGGYCSSEGDLGSYSFETLLIIGGHTTSSMTSQRQERLKNSVAETLGLASDRITFLSIDDAQSATGATTRKRRRMSLLDTTSSFNTAVTVATDVSGFASSVDAKSAMDSLQHTADTGVLSDIARQNGLSNDGILMDASTSYVKVTSGPVAASRETSEDTSSAGASDESWLIPVVATGCGLFLMLMTGITFKRCKKNNNTEHDQMGDFGTDECGIVTI